MASHAAFFSFSASSWLVFRTLIFIGIKDRKNFLRTTNMH
jgi:hypothetical protein